MKPQPRSRPSRFLPTSLWAPAAVLALLLPTSGVHAQSTARDWCEERDVGRNQFCEVRELTMQPRGDRLAIDVGANGGIQVEGYAGTEIRVTARVLARGRSAGAAEDIARQVDVRGQDGDLRATGPRSTGTSSWTVSVRVQVPTGTAIEARTTNGSIAVRSTFAAINARTTNGAITLADAAARVEARSTNGSIRASVSGAADAPESVQLRTTNGAIHLALPERTSARVDLSTTNGRISSDLPIAVQGTVNRRRMSGTIGSGDAEIRVSTTNGSIRIERN